MKMVENQFLTGPNGGQLLTTIRMDANNSIYPIAYAVVGVENFDHCFKKLHKGLALKERLWKCAAASYVNQFSAEMDGLKAEDEAAHAWLSDKPARFWSRSHFRTCCKCDILVNNMCESFNHAILKARDRPILTFFRTREKLDTYVDDCYKKEAYLRSYEPVVNPVSGHNGWLKTGLVVQPPNYGRRLGRPKKLRRKDLVELRKSRLIVNPNKPNLLTGGPTTSRGNCQGAGHVLVTTTPSRSALGKKNEAGSKNG
ncbi:hypothetical protein ACH5RR_023349 [Cinchona calisaya]|uniref:Transposase n=1 Tax=Cinchona calisaya TaxID=153742 RepID=A0ABD2ZAE5_9GENT